jgi:outer membrane protein OmpA-like peptidoglycan-associated protein
MKLFFFSFLLLTSLSFTQEYPFSSSIADCDGAAKIPQKGDVNISFTASPGVFLDLAEYQTKFKEANAIWLHFTAELSGFLNLKFSTINEDVEIIFFKSDKEKVCDIIGKGDLAPSYQTMLKNNDLNFSKENENFNFLELERGESVWIYLNNFNRKSTKNIQGKVLFDPFDQSEIESSQKNIVDLTSNSSSPKFNLSFKSKIDKKPIIAEVVIKNSKSFDALYNASELIISLERTLKFDVKVDAIGYFPKDTSFRITEMKDLESIIYLDPVMTGSQMKLEGIEFFPESENLTPDAKGKLKRIRDFLALNANLCIEVQGHVNQPGKNTFRAKKLSKKRAKAVRNYLISSGIDKSRVKFKGYGNEFMIYPEATTPEEKQANRRVEIKIL